MQSGRNNFNYPFILLVRPPQRKPILILWFPLLIIQSKLSQLKGVTLCHFWAVSLIWTSWPWPEQVNWSHPQYTCPIPNAFPESFGPACQYTIQLISFNATLSSTHQARFNLKDPQSKPRIQIRNVCECSSLPTSSDPGSHYSGHFFTVFLYPSHWWFFLLW